MILEGSRSWQVVQEEEVDFRCSFISSKLLYSLYIALKHAFVRTLQVCAAVPNTNRDIRQVT